MDTAVELEETLNKFYNEEIEEAKTSIDRIFAQEVEIDNLRRSIYEEMPEKGLPTGYREDLLGLVEHMDRMADHIKDSARSVRILMEANVPKDILGEYLKVAGNLRRCFSTLGECIETLGVDNRKTLETVQRVEAYEEEIDEEYIEMKTMLLLHSELSAAILAELMDLLDCMERAADTCTDTAESVRIWAKKR